MMPDPEFMINVQKMILKRHEVESHEVKHGKECGTSLPFYSSGGYVSKTYLQ